MAAATSTARPTMRSAQGYRNRKALEVWIIRIIVIIITFVTFFPTLYVILTSFKAGESLLAQSILPDSFTLENYTKLIETGNLPRWVRNSLILGLIGATISTVIATFAGYAFSRFRFPGGNVWSVGVLATQFIPPVIVVIPLFVAFRHAGLLDTRIALVIANMSFVVPYAIWMIKGFIDSIPLDMEEAAQIDGASRLRAIWDVVVPMALPGIATAAIFCFVVSWNEFFYALVLSRQDATTLQVGLMSARTERGDAWEIMAAMGLIIILPMLVLSRFVQQYFAKGLISGSVR